MGNSNSSSGGGISRRRQGNWRSQPAPPPPPQPPHPQIRPNSYIFAAPNPYHPSPQPGYYPLHPPAAMPMPMPMAPYHHHHGPPNWAAPASYPYGPIMPSPVPVPVPGPGPYVEHQKAVTIRNDVNVNKETLRLEPDQNNPGMFLLSFTFDATVPASITVMYFAKEGEDCKLTQTRESLIPPVTVHFERGLGQKFRQASGTGINFSLFEECDLVKKGDGDVCPLAVKAEACLVNQRQTTSDENPVPAGSTESQITQALFEKDGEEYKVKVLKQILWVNQTRYELQEIYGIGNTVAGESDGSDSLKECVICLSEPRDTTVLPCRHMCLCRECAKVLRFQANRCPICRQPIERLLEIKVSNGSDQETSSS